MPSENYLTLLRIIEATPVISTHEHHQPDEFPTQLTLDGVLAKSYVG